MLTMPDVSAKNAVMAALGVAVVLLIMTSHTGIPAHEMVARTISGTTGLLFKMKKFREFPKHELHKARSSDQLWHSEGKRCKQ